MNKFTKEFIELKIAEKFFELKNINISFKNGDPNLGEPDIVGEDFFIEIFSVHYSQEIKQGTEYQIKKTGKAYVTTIGPDKMALENLLEGIKKKESKDYLVPKNKIILLIDLRELALTTMNNMEEQLKGRIISTQFKEIYLFHYNLIVNGELNGENKYLLRRVF